MNLLDMVKGQLTDTVLQKLGGSVGLGSAEVSKAMNAIIPTQLDAITKLGASPTGAQNLMNLASNFTQFGNISNVLNQADGLQGLLKAGQGLLPSLFGSKLGDVVQALASHTGVGGNAINSLMSLAGPLVMGTLGSQIKTQGLNPMGLVNMLGGLKGVVGAALPAGLGKLLDIGNVGAMAGAAGQAASSAVGQAARGASTVAGQVGNAVGQSTSRRGGLAWWIPALALLLLGGAAWLFTRPQPAPVSTPTTETTAPATDSGATTTTASGTAACTGDLSLSVTDGQTVTQPFRFGGTGGGEGYAVTVKRPDRVIGTKQMPLDSNCSFGYDSLPGKGPITYELRPLNGDLSAAPLQVINLTIE